MMNLLTGYFNPKYILRKKEILGELPATTHALKEFFKVAWPSMLESILIGLVAFIDTQMVSVLGTDSVGAVGITNQPRMLFYAVFFAINIGVTAIVSRRTGEKDFDGARQCLAQSVTLTVVLGAVLCFLAILFAEPLVSFADAEEKVLADSTAYFQITMLGMLFTSIGMTINAAHRGTGKTDIAMVTNITANLINCLFNYLLISGNFGFPALGVRGAAIATLMGNMVSCFMSVWSVFGNKKCLIHIKLKDCLVIRKDILMLHASVSRNAAIEQLFLRIGFFITALMVNRLGNESTSTNTICMNILTLSFCLGDGLGVATSALVGMNLGKKRKDLSLMYGSIGQRVGFICSILFMLLFFFFGTEMVSWFIPENDPNEQFIMNAAEYIMILLAFTMPAQISMVVYIGCLRGAGDTFFVALSSLVSITIIRPLFTYIFVYACSFGVVGAYGALLVDHYFRLLFSYLRFRSGKWTKIKI